MTCLHKMRGHNDIISSYLRHDRGKAMGIGREGQWMSGAHS